VSYSLFLSVCTTTNLTLGTTFGGQAKGTNRIFRALTHKDPKVRKKALGLVTGITATGFTMSMLNRATDEDEWEQFSEYDKMGYFMYMLPNGKSVSVKLPYGYNFFYALGVTMEEVVRGDVRKQEGFYRLLNSAVGAFSPISGGSVGQAISPTITEPLVQILENKNFTGAPLANIQPMQPRKPRSQEHFKTVRPQTKAFTDWLNEFGGGSENKQGGAGFLDWNPEYLDALYDSYTGGIGKFIGNTFSTGESLLQGNLPEQENVPVIRQFLRDPKQWQARSVVYDMLKESRRMKFDKDQKARYKRSLNQAVKAQSIDRKKAKSLWTKFNKNQRTVK